MGKKTLKGKKGSSVNYITRTEALRKLQITLPEFRKLCILKGIYPREPKKAPKGKDKTYYFRKDITFLLHDPLIQKFRDRHAWKKKLTKAKAKGQTDEVASLKERRPVYSLNHLVKERYPTFVDALRDLDDPLCHVVLFAQMPATLKIHASRVNNCKRLAQEFQYYIMKTHALRKVFLSIKGIYYQAEIMGQQITWLVPYQFTQRISESIDYTVMLAFLEFYEVLLSFVNFKLYHTLSLVYPPQLDGMALKSEKEAMPRAAPVVTQTKKAGSEESESESGSESEQEEDPSLEEDKPDEEDDEEDMNIFANDETVQLRQRQDVYSDLFKNCTFWVGRECPLESLEFVIKSFGGKVLSDDFGLIGDPSITHHIVDRPTVLGKQDISREYVQPQWVYDSINNLMLLPTELYGVGVKLPPHLSPFIDDNAQGYVPEYRQKLDELREGPKAAEDSEEDVEESSDEEDHAKELEAEKDGNYKQEKNARASKRKRSEKEQAEENAEQLDTAESLLPKRKRRLLQRIKYSQRMKEGEINKLEEKKLQLDSGNAVVSREGIIEYK